MVFVVSQALVDLGPGDIGKAVGNQGVHALSILQESNDIMDADAGSLDFWIPVKNAEWSSSVRLRRQDQFQLLAVWL